MCTQPQQAMMQTATAPAKTILLVEEDPERGDFLTSLLLEKSAYRVLLASNSLAALHLIRYLKPDLLIVHDQWPTTYGTELADRLHAIRGFEAVPAILLGSHFSTQESMRNMVRLSDPLDLSSLLLITEAILTQPTFLHYATTERIDRQLFFTRT